jgi:hypothetical protein
LAVLVNLAVSTPKPDAGSRKPEAGSRPEAVTPVIGGELIYKLLHEIKGGWM